MSIVTAEEYYRDSLDILIDIRDIQKQIFEELGNDLVSTLHEIKSNSVQTTKNEKSSNVSSMSGSLDISGIVESVNSINSEKSKDVANLFDSISKVTVPKLRSVELNKFATNVGEFISTMNEIDLTKEKLELYSNLSVLVGGISSMSKSLSLNAPYIKIATLVSKKANTLFQNIFGVLNGIEFEEGRMEEITNMISITNSIGSMSKSLSLNAPNIKIATIVSKNINELFNNIFGAINVIKIEEQNVEDLGKIQSMISSISLLSKNLSLNAPYIKIATNISKNISELLSSLSSSIDSIDVEKEKIEDVTNMQSMVSSIGSMSRSLTLNAPFILIAMPVVRMLPFLFSSITSAVNSISGSKEEIKEFPSLLRNVGLGLTIFSAGLSASLMLVGMSFISNPLAILALVGAIGVVALTSRTLGRDGADIRRGAISMGIMGLTLPLLSFGIVTSANMFSSTSATDLLMMTASVGAMALIYNLIGGNNRNILRGSLSVGFMSLSLMAFAGAMSFASNQNISGSTAIMLPLMISGMGLSFALVGMMNNTINKGALSVGFMSLSLMALSFPLSMLTPIMDSGNSLFKIPLILGGLGLTFGLIGMMNNTVNKGALSVAFMSLSLMALAVPLMIMTPIMNSGSSLFMLPLLLGGLALTYGLAGLVDSYILKGSLAFTAIGVSLTILSIGVGISSAILANSPNLENIPIVLGGLGLIYGIAGFAWMNIVKGAVAFGAIGLSLMTIASPIQRIGIALSNTGDVLWKLPTLLGGLGLTYGIAGMAMSNILMGAVGFGAIGLSLWTIGSPLAEITTSIKDGNVLWKLPVLLTALGTVYGVAGMAMPFILSGAVAFGAIGGSLWLIGKGLKAFAEIPEIDSEKIDSFKNSIRGVIDGINVITLRDMMTLPLKIPVIAGMGLGLIPLAKGLSDFSSKTKGFDQKEADRLSYVISATSRAFTIAGNPSGMSTLFGFKVGKNDVERGIDATMKIGRNLNVLSKGLMVWRDAKFSDQDIKMISKNVTNIMNTIPAVFADIGQRERGSSNQIKFGGLSFGVPFTKSDTELGIQSTMGIGMNLKRLYDGIIVWKNAKFSEQDVKVISRNVTNIMNTIPAIFASIGQRERGSSNQISFGGLSFGVPFTKSDTELGISSTMHMGNNLKRLYDGIIVWKTGGKNDISKQIPSIINNIKSILTAIPKAFDEVGKLANEDSKFFGLIDGNMEDGLELVTRMTTPLKNISLVVQSFNKDVNAVKASKGMSLMLINLARSLDGFTDRRIKTLEKLNRQFGGFNKHLKAHFDIIAKLPKDRILKFEDYTKALKTLGDVHVENMISSISKQNQYLETQKNDNITEIKAQTAKLEAQKTKLREEKIEKAVKSGKGKEEALLEAILSAVADKTLETMILAHLKTGIIKTEEQD